VKERERKNNKNYLRFHIKREREEKIMQKSNETIIQINLNFS